MLERARAHATRRVAAASSARRPATPRPARLSPPPCTSAAESGKRNRQPAQRASVRAGRRTTSSSLGHFLGHRATRPPQANPHKQHKLDGDPDPGNIAFYKHNKPSKLCSDSS